MHSVIPTTADYTTILAASAASLSRFRLYKTLSERSVNEMNLKSGHIQQFRHYSQFTNLKEFNAHIEMWLLDHVHEFTKSELLGLKRLSRFSAKIPVICNAKIGTILKAIHEEYNDNGISRSTFKRMLKKAVTIGILTIYKTDRKTGLQSSNLYIFNRFPTIAPPAAGKLNHHNKTSNLSKTKQIKDDKRKQEQNQELDYSYTSDRVPESFNRLVKCIFRDTKTIEEFWHMTNIAAYRNNRENEPDLVLTLAIDSYKQLARKLKTTKKVRNPIAYYYGIINKKFDDVYFEELSIMGFGVKGSTDCGNQSTNIL